MKIPTFAALCLMATMSLGCGVAEPEQEDDFDSISEELESKGKSDGKDDGKGKEDHCFGVAFVACNSNAITCAADKGNALRTAVLNAVKKAAPKFVADKDLKVCMKNARQLKKDLKEDQMKAICDAYKPYRDACKKEIHAAKKAAFPKDKN